MGSGSGSGSGNGIVWNGQNPRLAFWASDPDANLASVEVTNFDSGFVASAGITYSWIDGSYASGTVDLTFLTSAVGTTQIELTAYDTEGLSSDTFIYTVETYGITGWTVEEKPWGAEQWNAPEDGNVLWAHNANRWQVTTDPTGILETDERLENVSVGWYLMPWSTFCTATLEYRANLSNWQPGTPWQGDLAVMPRIDFGAGTAWQGSAARYFLAAIQSVEWEEAAWSRVVEIEAHNDTPAGIAKLQWAGEDNYRVYPAYQHGDPALAQPDDHSTVRVKVTLAAPIPEGLAGTVHLAWYDPDNTVANLPGNPPANDGHGQRDNAAGVELTEAGDPLPGYTLTFSTEGSPETSNSIQKAYLVINEARYGDNFIMAAHPNEGVEESYEFQLLDPDGSGSGGGSSSGSGSGSGSGTGGGGGATPQRVLKYRHLVDTGSGSGSGGEPQQEERWDVLPNQFRTSILTIHPSVDIDTDSDNSDVIERSDWEEAIENEAGYSGKIVFFNHNDHNANSIPDYLENADYEYPPGLSWVPFPDPDLVPVVLDRGFADLSGMNGFVFELKVTVDRGLRYWLDPEKTSITADQCLPITEGGNEKALYRWFVSGAAVSYPPLVYVEGVDPDALTDTLMWRLFKPIPSNPPGGDPAYEQVAEDTVKMTDPASALEVDIEVDSNNDGMIDDTDDPAAIPTFEKTAPGKILAVGVNQRQRAKLKVTAPGGNAGDYTYTLVYNAGVIEIYNTEASGSGIAPSGILIPPNVDLTTKGITVAQLLAGVELYMDGVNINTDDLILRATKGATNEKIEDQVRINVALDLDTDSDNDGDILTTDTAEDKDEDWAEIDSAKVGKRLFLNSDDDNKNAEEDRVDNQTAYIGSVDNDLVKVTAQFTETNMPGYKIVLEHAPNLAIHVATGSLPTPEQVTGPSLTVWTQYTWDLGPSTSWPGSLTVLAEGTDLGPGKINFRLLKGATILAKDAVQMNVETMVWPDKTQSDTAWYEQESSEWDGVKVPAKWIMEKTLEDFIKDKTAAGPSNQGTLTTPMPDTDTSVNQGKNDQASVEGDDAPTTDDMDFTNGFLIELEYTFDATRGDIGQGYVRNPEHWRPGFVPNSGVKFNNRTLEAAILDVKAYVALAGGIAKFDPALGGTNVLADGKIDIDNKSAVNVTHDFADVADEATFFAGRPFEPRHLHGLLTGVEYGGAYRNMTDTGNDDPANGAEFYAALKENHDRTNAKIKVDVYEENGAFQLRIYLDGLLTYAESINSWQASPLWIQSHWGSGVMFSSMDITERP